MDKISLLFQFFIHFFLNEFSIKINIYFKMNHVNVVFSRVN
jgi:hypothetical protein